MNFRHRIETLARQAKKVQLREAELQAARQMRLARLPEEFGYSDLASFLNALRHAALTAGGAKKRPRQSARSHASRRQVQKSFVETPPSPSSIVTSPVEPAAPPSPQLPRSPPPLPTGTSLDDPAHFGLLPDTSVLERGMLDVASYRGRVRTALDFATKVLHTSKVPAAVWREWRQFERQLSQALRAGSESR